MWITNVTQNRLLRYDNKYHAYGDSYIYAYDMKGYLNLVSYKQWDDYKRKANLVGIVLWNHVGMYYCNYS